MSTKISVQAYNARRAERDELRNQRDQLLSAAKELIAQTDLIHYTGPFIGPRLAALRAAIDAVESKSEAA